MVSLNDTQNGRLRWIFVGPNGIRAGWSMLIFVALLAVTGGVLRLMASHFHAMPKGPIPIGAGLIAEGASLALVMAATAIMGWIEGRPFWAYGLRGSRPVTGFLYGFAGGFASLSLLVAVLYGGGYLVFDGFALHGPSIVLWAVPWLFAFLLVGLTEETMFRGYIQSTLARGIGFWPGAILVSLLFGAVHLQNPGENPLGIVQVVAAGLIFCLLLWLSGSLWLAIGFHTAWDWAQSFFYGTPDSGLMMAQHLFITHATGNPRFSGGAAGPEGSILAAPISLLCLVALVLVCRRMGLFEK